MKSFREIAPSQLGNAMEMVGKQWMLITAKDEKNGRVNAMTASWGCMGVLWNLPVCVLFIRPQRHTCPLAEEADRLSLAFLGEEHREALRICGRESGRDMDKLARCGLHTVQLDGVDAIEEAETVLIVKPLYVDTLKEASFLDPSLLKHYEGDYHRVFVCQLEKAYQKNGKKDPTT
ncbi:MAG: flavin reductase family protein [Clostridia bacterium]|nr:flavin reductase family protein [Clostridia bacterium]